MEQFCLEKERCDDHTVIYKLFNEFYYGNRMTEYKMFENKFRILINSQHLILSNRPKPV